MWGCHTLLISWFINFKIYLVLVFLNVRGQRLVGILRWAVSLEYFTVLYQNPKTFELMKYCCMPRLIIWEDI